MGYYDDDYYDETTTTTTTNTSYHYHYCCYTWPEAFSAGNSLKTRIAASRLNSRRGFGCIVHGNYGGCVRATSVPQLALCQYVRVDIRGMSTCRGTTAEEYDSYKPISPMQLTGSDEHPRTAARTCAAKVRGVLGLSGLCRI